ncbi:aldose epimerase family protein [Sphingomonas cavernae]|uniref:Aldose 1-epimerase n=1 Tax=Sphingomonas cavernae TaxID=2320861 RepID=A0A418WNE3_9SPHN|nr:aldose epimerase family protein [Sphingomonas cavernae]RJF91510.1 galactose mutarotase [Sphingomonas cavernae]
MLKNAVTTTLAAMALATGAPAIAADYQRASFGTLPDGRAVEAVTLTNGNGVSARVIAYGATLQALEMPDREGRKADVLLGYPTLDGYVEKRDYFGSTVGRFANRIAGGKFSLDGKQYQTTLNEGANALHGGIAGFDKVLWDVVRVTRGKAASVTLRYVSPDGDQGYPGKLTVLATYSLDEANQLTIEYSATTDRSTVVNITNHAYWNLAGEGSPAGAMGHVLTIPADHFTPVNVTLIPTGELKAVEGTPFDFRKPMVVGARVRDTRDEQIVFGRGYDHNFVISKAPVAKPQLMAQVSDPVSGRAFEIWSNQPGLQFYSGNFLDGKVVGKSGQAYRQGDTVVFEPQLFPDAPNQSAFASSRLDPGQTYRNTIIYRLSTGQR